MSVIDLEKRFFETIGLKQPCQWRENLNKQVNSPAVSEAHWGVFEEKPVVYEWQECEAC